jgi:hypothetical protein
MKKTRTLLFRRRCVRFAFALAPMLAIMGVLAAAPPASAGQAAMSPAATVSRATAVSHVGTVSQTGRLTSVAVIPESSSGCNQDVCISVCNNINCTGSGLYVTYVGGTGYPPIGDSTNPTVAKVWVRGVVRDTSSGLPLSTRVVIVFPFGYNVDNGSQICMTFTGIPGKACETVHS